MWTRGARIAHAPREERYPSDVTDAEWEIIAPMIPSQRQGGRRRETDMRDVMNAVPSQGTRQPRKVLSQALKECPPSGLQRFYVCGGIRQILSSRTKAHFPCVALLRQKSGVE